MKNTNIFKNDKLKQTKIFDMFDNDAKRKNELDKLFLNSLRNHIIKYLDSNINKSLSVEIQGNNFFVRYGIIKFEFWTVAKTTSKNYIPNCIVTCYNRVLNKDDEKRIGCKLKEWKNYTVIGIESFDVLIRYLDLIIDNLNLRQGKKKNPIVIANLDAGDKDLKATTKNGVHTYKTEGKIRDNALLNANYCCEVDKKHKSFISNNGNQYAEGHHLIPMKYQKDFNNSLDIEENIVSLCPNCHREIHYGVENERIIEILYNKRVERLKQKGISITLKKLISYYKYINISDSKIKKLSKEIK